MTVPSTKNDLKKSNLSAQNPLASLRRRLVWVLPILVLVTIFSVRQLTAESDENAPSAMDSLVPVNTGLVQYQNAHTVRHNYTGRIAARRKSDLGFDLGGILSVIYVQDGDSVKHGDPIAKMDTKRVELRLQKAKADKDGVAANLLFAKDKRLRIERLHKKGNTSDQSLDQAIATETVLKARLSQVETQIAIEKLNLSRSVLRAPFDGAIDRRLLDEGVVIAMGTPVVTFLEAGSLEANIGIPRAQAQHLPLSTSVILTSEDGHIFRAKVSRKTPAIRGDTRTLLVTFNFEEPVQVNDGELVTITVKVNRQGRGFWVPLRALTADIRGMWRLYRIEGENESNKIVFENVQILHVDGARAFVSGSINEDSRFLSEGLARVTPGQSVRVLNSSK